eukprot:gene22583-23789_t
MQTTDIRSALDALLNQQQPPTTGNAPTGNGTTEKPSRKLREVVVSARIEVLDELRDGNRYADRHRVHVTKHDGSKVVQEVYLFAELDAEGRFARIEETTLMLEGVESDREMGSMK